jgi:hypothetical protein
MRFKTSSPASSIIRSAAASASWFDFFAFYQIIPPVSATTMASNSAVIPK